jgi:hypothetical protein
MLALKNAELGRQKAAASRQAKAASRTADLLPVIDAIRAEGITSATGIAKALNERGIPTTRGGRWQAVQEIRAAPCIVVRELTTELVNFSRDRTPFDARSVRRRGVGWVIIHWFELGTLALLSLNLWFVSTVLNTLRETNRWLAFLTRVRWDETHGPNSPK